MEDRDDENEAARLEAVHRYHLLDTAPEGAYDDLTRLASYICGTPISLMSLVDSDRQWFKSRHGIDVEQTPRSVSFCAHTIQSDRTMEVRDAAQDPRFSDNPLVRGPPHLRYYAAAPLVTPDGYRLGTLCVIDYKPRDLSSEQLDMLAALSRQAVTQMELRRQTGELEQAREHLQEANANLEQQVMARTAELRGAMDTLLRQTEEARAAEAVLREREAELAQSQKVEIVGRLAGGMAHDFNNLLTVVLGCTELAGGELPPGSQAQADLGEIRRAAMRARELTTQLLAFTRRPRGEPSVVEVGSLLDDMRRLLGRVLAESIELRIESARELWPVCMDPRRLEQVLVNLAVNARDAMPGGGLLVIAARNESVDQEQAGTHGKIPVGEYVVISVSDTGTGMPAEVMARLFEPFFTTKPSGAGTGLGLATSAWMLAQAGGQLNARSQPGRGSVFEIYLPRHRGEASAAEPAATAPAPAQGREALLFVDDDAAIRGVSRRVLHSHGYEVLEAGGGDDALQALARAPGPVQLAIVDVVMPRMGGAELVKTLRSRWPSIKVLYISGYAQPAPDALGPGTSFISKPYTPEVLLQEVRALLDAR